MRLEPLYYQSFKVFLFLFLRQTEKYPCVMINLPEKPKTPGIFIFFFMSLLFSQKGLIKLSINNYNPNLGILQDTKNGKDNNWKERKESTLDLAASYKRIGSNKYYRVLDCSTFLEFRLTTVNDLKLTNANFCKVRLCPMCSWRRSLKIFGQVSKVMDYVEENYNYT